MTNHIFRILGGGAETDDTGTAPGGPAIWPGLTAASVRPTTFSVPLASLFMPLRQVADGRNQSRSLRITQQ
jgi:hypothetical protein